MGDRDVDLFKINSPQTGILEINVDSDINDPVNTVILIFDESGDRTKNTTVDEFGIVTIDSNRLYAPFVIANAGEIGFDGFMAAEKQENDGQFNDAAQTRDDAVAYFSFIDANPDNARHLESRGNGIFGFEDLPANLDVSDNDFNDAVFQFDFS